jgi:hypothetical protein
VRLGILVAAAGAIAVVVVLLPTHEGHRRETFSDRPALVYHQPRRVRLTTAEHRAIEAVLVRFVRGAVARQDPLAAYDLATPALRAAATRGQWRRGELPVAPYTPRGRPGWRVDVAHPGDAVLDVLLQPGHGERKGIIYTVEVKRLGGRWLVDSFTPSATFGGGSVYSRTDMGPQTITQPTRGRIDGRWLLVLAGCLAAALALVPVGALRSGRRRTRRAKVT